MYKKIQHVINAFSFIYGTSDNLDVFIIFNYSNKMSNNEYYFGMVKNITFSCSGPDFDFPV